MKIPPLPIPRHVATILVAAGLAPIIAGCGLQNPNTVTLGASTPTAATSPAAASTPSTTATTQPTAANAGGVTPQAAITQYAQLWCNWTSNDLRAHERQLEALSVGGAHTQEQLALAAPSQPTDNDVSGSGAGAGSTTTTCVVDSLAPGRGGAAGKWVLVTASHTSTPSTATLPAQYHVTYITLARRGARYLVNSWQPQS